MAITTLPVTYSDGNVLSASDLTQNFNALNTATVPVANGGTGLTSYTSGGIIYASGTGTLASSGALTQYGVVYGGGAGATPVATAAGTTDQVLVATTSAAPSWGTTPVPRAYLAGLAVSNNGSDATNDIDIAVGVCRDKDNSATITLASALTKQLDAVWAVGTNAGMRATGAAITDTTYHIFAILRPDTGVVDIAADTSITGANIAANTNAAYTKIRRIGSIVRTGGAIKAFSQNGDEVLWSAAALDLNAVPNSTTAANATLTVPVGIKVEALFRAQLTDATTSGIAVLFSSPDESDQAASETAAPGASIVSVGAGPAISGHFRVRTNTSAQIRYRMETADVDADVQISTYGYIDRRGRDD
jgi:hypothetical protein